MSHLDLDTPLKIGTRGSPLAVAQSRELRDRLVAAHGMDPALIEIVTIKTTADRVLDRELKLIGGKGLFTKEIELSLLAGEVDLALHCVKDMAVEQPPGLVVDCHLPREDVRDVFVSEKYAGLDAMPAGTVVGTSSMRRKAQILHRRPDLQVVNFRGNVQSRLQKLTDGVADATLLAAAGLIRLGMTDLTRNTVATTTMLPAVGQGALAVQRRGDDARMAALVAPLNDPDTMVQMAAERSFLATLEGSCETPIAGLAELTADGTLWLRGEILRTDGTEVFADEIRGAQGDAATMGQTLARSLLARAPADFFDWKRPQGPA